MTERDFCYWLQGFFELNKPLTLNEEQTLEVKKHLYNVFEHKCEKLDAKVVEKFFEGKTLKDFKDLDYKPVVPNYYFEVEELQPQTEPDCFFSFPNGPPASC